MSTPPSTRAAVRINVRIRPEAPLFRAQANTRESARVPRSTPAIDPPSPTVVDLERTLKGGPRQLSLLLLSRPSVLRV